jgi:hypothetical protein
MFFHPVSATQQAVSFLTHLVEANPFLKDIPAAIAAGLVAASFFARYDRIAPIDEDRTYSLYIPTGGLGLLSLFADKEWDIQAAIAYLALTQWKSAYYLLPRIINSYVPASPQGIETIFKVVKFASINLIGVGMALRTKD